MPERSVHICTWKNPTGIASYENSEVLPFLQVLKCYQRPLHSHWIASFSNTLFKRCKSKYHRQWWELYCVSYSSLCQCFRDYIWPWYIEIDLLPMPDLEHLVNSWFEQVRGWFGELSIEVNVTYVASSFLKVMRTILSSTTVMPFTCPHYHKGLVTHVNNQQYNMILGMPLILFPLVHWNTLITLLNSLAAFRGTIYRVKIILFPLLLILSSPPQLPLHWLN